VGGADGRRPSRSGDGRGDRAAWWRRPVAGAVEKKAGITRSLTHDPGHALGGPLQKPPSYTMGCAGNIMALMTGCESSPNIV
jgi:hypothetical protein